MQALELRIPPLVLVAAAGLSMWLLRDTTPELRLAFYGQNFAAASLAFIGLFFCLAGVLAFRRANTTTNPMTPVATSSLVTSGLYQITRNPMYVGFVLLLLGWGVFLGNPLAVLVIGAFIWYLTRFQVIPEERALRSMFGAQYESYCRDVRRWI
jgi:protein-S-isoprenylcysteine O-methyltransferase Ste14